MFGKHCLVPDEANRKQRLLKQHRANSLEAQVPLDTKFNLAKLISERRSVNDLGNELTFHWSVLRSQQALEFQLRTTSCGNDLSETISVKRSC